jgi:CDP-diacylglycerol--glycerol-3-phosphate 3-phosphatidyltransferase
MEKQVFKDKARRVLDPVVSGLAAAGIPPLFVSILGLLLSLYGAVKTAHGSLFLGAVFLLLAGLCDIMDGSLARRLDAVSRFGAFMDSFIDRVTEFVYFGAIIFYYLIRPQGYSLIQIGIVIVSLAGSVLISYARARAEGLGFTCAVGLMERPERMAVLILGLLLGSHVLMIALVFLAVSTVLTFSQRVVHVYKAAKAD